jgi:hypothetical protein
LRQFPLGLCCTTLTVRCHEGRIRVGCFSLLLRLGTWRKSAVRSPDSHHHAF